MPSVAELKAEAKKRGHKGYSKMKKGELVSLLGKGGGMSQKAAFVRKLKAEGKSIKPKSSSAPAAPKPQRKVIKPADIDFPEEGAQRKVLKPPPGMAEQFDTRPAERRKRLEEIKLKQEERKKKLAERNQKRMEGKLPPLPLSSELKAAERKQKEPKKEEPKKESKPKNMYEEAFDRGILERNQKLPKGTRQMAFPFPAKEVKKNRDIFALRGSHLWVVAKSKSTGKTYYYSLVGDRMYKKPKDNSEVAQGKVAKNEFFDSMNDMFKRYLELRK